MSIKKTIIMAVIRRKMVQPSTIAGVVTLVYTGFRSMGIELPPELSESLNGLVLSVIGILLVMLRESGEKDDIKAIKDNALSASIVDMADRMRLEQTLPNQSVSRDGPQDHGGFNG